MKNSEVMPEPPVKAFKKKYKVLYGYASKESAVTLLEVLIAVTIFTVIMATLYSSFFLSHKAVESVDGSLVRLQECRLVVDLLKREIEAALYSDDKPYSVFRVVDRDFYGRQASRMEFTAFSSQREGLSKITYTVEEQDGNLVLKKKFASPFSPSRESGNIELMEAVEAFDIALKYNDEWVRTWDSELAGKIPEEVEISVSVMLGDSKSPVVVSDRARPMIGKRL